MESLTGVSMLVICLTSALLLGASTFTPQSIASAISNATNAPAHYPLRPNHPAVGTGGAFAFVSNFADGALDGWTSLSGSVPLVSSKTTYFGEQSLASSASKGVQVDVASQGFVAGGSFVSFQVAINSGSGAGYFGLADASNHLVAVVGVSNGQVVAGRDVASLAIIEPVPTGTAYPPGWVYLSGNVYNAGSKTPSWVMQVFVDRSDVIAATVSVPAAASYSGAEIETVSLSVYYSNIVVSSYQIPNNIPGYNNMDGYGQGSGLLVQLLPAFYKLTAEMTLTSWTTPQVGILSFQINAMNLYGTTRSTCGGFFQLGIDLNPNGTIAPWYVPGKNCIAHYFLQSNTPAIQPGISSPPGTHLVLTITDNLATDKVEFTIVDTSIGQTFTASIPYGGGPFYGSYTQLEWQPCCSNFPIDQYHFNGSLYNMQITTLNGTHQPLRSDYMLPFVLDAPPVWSLTCYQDQILGYDQQA